MASKTIAIIKLGDIVMAACPESQADQLMKRLSQYHGPISSQDQTKAALKWSWQTILFFEENLK